MTSEDEISYQEVSNFNPIPEEAEEYYNIHIATIVHRLYYILPELKIEGDLFKRENGLKIVKNVVRNFNAWKEEIKGDRSGEYDGMKHMVIFCLAKLCFYYWITDSTIVSHVLSLIYNCDGHFSSFFTHIVNRQNSINLWPSCFIESKQNETLTFMYFLSHAHNAKMDFRKIRLVDIKLLIPLRVPPSYLACIYFKPKLLLLALRYGADMERRPFRSSDDWDINMLLRHLIRTVWSSMGPEYQSTDWEKTAISTNLKDVLECLNILLRAINQIDKGELDFGLPRYIQGVSEIKKSLEFITWLSETGVVPRLVSRYQDPCELQHLCRLVIRNALNKNWNLPCGISSLPLPKILREFINIARD